MRSSARCALAVLAMFGIDGVDASAAYAAKHSQLEIGGRFELGIAARFRRSEFQKQLSFDLKAGADGPVRAAADIEITHEAGDARIRELHVDLDTGYGWLSIGQKKKKFGLDSDLGTKARLTLAHGLLYEKLGSYAYVGRDSAIELRSARDAESRWSHALSVHSSEGMTISAIYESKYQMSEAVSVRSYTLYQATSLAHAWHSTEGQVLAFQGEWERSRVEAELMVAGDPWESAYLKSVGVERFVYFLGASIGSGWRVGNFRPFLKAALLQHDFGTWGDRTFEVTPGLKYSALRDVELGAELRWLSSPIPQGFQRSLSFDSGTTFSGVARYYF